MFGFLHDHLVAVSSASAISSQSITFYGMVKDFSTCDAIDIGNLIRAGNKVVVKQYNFTTDYDSYAVELNILIKIKLLKLKKNGGFPYVLSTKCCSTHGEIVMTNVG